MKGAFIVFEGIDGTGKSSLCSAIAGMLERDGRSVVTTFEPTDGPIGRLIRSKGFNPVTEALLFAADRSHHSSWIGEQRAKGKTVLCDRYFASSLAYQSAAGADPAWIREINSKGILVPDITLVLDVPVEVGMARVGNRGPKTRFEDPEYLEKVREAYLAYARETGCPVIDATAPADEVARAVYETIKEGLGGI